MDEWFQLAKDYAKAEKELEVQHWVFISIECTDGRCNYERLFCYDLPREVYERRRWVIEWRKSKFVCQYPKGNVRYYTCYYDKRLGTDARLNEDLRRLISAKAQITKAERKMNEYINYNRQNNMFFDENTDEEVVRFKKNLDRKKANVAECESRLKSIIAKRKETDTSL